MNKLRRVLVWLTLLLILGGAAHPQLTSSGPLAIVTRSPLPQGWFDIPYSQTLGVTGGVPPYAWSMTSGSLPGGLTLERGGVISGTPTSKDGSFNFTVQVKDTTGATATAPFALTIREPQGFDGVYLFSDPLHTVFATEPNTFLVSTIKNLKPGKALDIGMGQGRNAVYLATQGWDVTGCDIADEGMKIAAQNAAKAGFHITTTHARLEDYDYGKERWDLIYIIYVDAPVVDPLYVARIRTALKPGGLVLIDTPRRPLDNSAPQWQERDSDQINALTKAWSDMQIVFYEDTVGIADWWNSKGPRLEEKIRIVRLLARKM